ncbi:hypothetical protein B0A49_08504 [Cryomyces minteri]|uniref:SAM domain-containing protein n=1 Tax=Cryomyces minteri TaxID=331657 RepID=A0A4V5NEC0_9PEZI|nr:hypothetical protein B0A49_08504 [Cryomyces minteri]
MQAMTPLTPLEAGVEMFQKGKLQSFFNASNEAPKPLSTATETYDTDFEDDSSEFEEYELDSPKGSYDSSDSRRRSQTTISTYDELPTPGSAQESSFGIYLREIKPVEGPRGPHLFRSSQSSAESIYDYALQMSPLLPKEPPSRVDTGFSQATIMEARPPIQTSFSTFPAAVADLDSTEVRQWSAEQVAAWMHYSGFEEAIIEKFEANDINGAVLLDLQFDDLKELEIQSFGKRYQLWSEIDALRGGDGRVSPAPTPFQDTSRPCTADTRCDSSRDRLRARRGDCVTPIDDGMTPVTPGGGKRRRGRKNRHDDIITPAESVSIVAIEQLLPKPHKCNKGERCAKYRKQQRQLARLHEEHSFPISPERGGHIFIAGNPGNASSAENIVEDVRRDENVYRRTSEAVPSVVASSDVLGPGQLPEFALQEDMLRALDQRDPQENVKQFLNFQHMHEPPQEQFEEPSTPPLELFPPLHPPKQTPAQGLKSLPRLAIPRSASANPCGPRQLRSANTFSPCRSVTASPGGVYRFGTPASEMDIPITAIQMGPIARDTSRSVPPNMQLRNPIVRSASRTDAHWRRPSFALPAVQEHASEAHATAPKPSNAYGAAHAGWMKKRKTKLLRHEWHDQHFRLHGTQLAMHASAAPASKPLDTIDVDNYAVACSSLASNNKLAARFKALNLGAKNRSASTAPDPVAFSFQLVPTATQGEGKGGFKPAAAAGKTHHFAVGGREERIDWMRELMLAKARGRKSEGCEVRVNGNAI